MTNTAALFVSFLSTQSFRQTKYGNDNDGDVYPFAMVRILLKGYIRDPGSGPPRPLRGLEGAAGLPPCDGA